MSETRLYTTTDIALASYLHAKGVRLILVEQKPNDFAEITFELNGDEELLAEWQSLNCMINARAYYDSYKLLQRKVHGR